jgi:hypothetical protein
MMNSNHFCTLIIFVTNRCDMNEFWKLNNDEVLTKKKVTSSPFRFGRNSVLMKLEPYPFLFAPIQNQFEIACCMFGLACVAIAALAILIPPVPSPLRCFC